MSDIHALSGAYAVDALDDAERARFEQHLAECAECRAEVASFRETTTLLTETATETPPATLRDSVLGGIRQVRPLPPEQASVPERLPTTVRGRRRLPHLMVAAAAIVLLAVGALVWQPWQHDRASITDQVLNASDAVRVSKPLAGGGELTLVRSPSLRRAVLLGHDVPPAGAGKTYQMWLQQPGHDMVSAGLMPDPDEPTVLTGDAATATAAAVSVEPTGGSVRPSAAVVAVFTLPASGGT
jgi:anti-sigma-K factor RskA